MTELAARLLPHGAACAGLREPTHVHLVLTGPGGGTWDVAVGVDEWGTVEQLQQFFSDPDLQAFIGSVGAAPAPPEITVTEAIASPDQY